MKKYTKLLLARKYVYYKDYKKTHFGKLSKKSLARKAYHFISALSSIPFLFSLSSKEFFFMPYFEIVITTKCTLRCKNCSNLMQYYKSPTNVDMEECINELKILLNQVDKVGMVNVLGGEPLIHNDIDKLLDVLITSNKVMNVEVTTNGTLLPRSESTVNKLKDEKVSVFVSNYGKKSTQYEKLITLLEENNINYVTSGTDWSWIDQGDLSCRERTKEELKIQYNRCEHDCFSFYKGELHYCPRSTHGMDLEVMPRVARDYFSIKDSNIEKKELKAKLKKFVYDNTDYIEACNYCDDGLEDTKMIKPGEGIE